MSKRLRALALAAAVVLLAGAFCLVGVRQAQALTWTIKLTADTYQNYLQDDVIVIEADSITTVEVYDTGGYPIEVRKALMVKFEGVSLTGRAGTVMKSATPVLTVNSTSSVQVQVIDSTLTGASGQPAICVPEGSTALIMSQGGTFVGGEGAPAIGVASGKMGQVEFDTGTTTATLSATNAPCVGVRVSYPREASGTLQVDCGTITMTTSGFDYDVMVGTLSLSGGSLVLSNPSGKFVGAVHRTSGETLVPVKVTGLAAGASLEGMSFTINGETYQVFSGYESNSYRMTSATAPEGWTYIYMPVSAFTSENVGILTLANGARYAGCFAANGNVSGAVDQYDGGGYYTLSLGEQPSGGLTNPTVDLSTILYGYTKFEARQYAGFNMYSIKDGPWQIYTGTLTLVGHNENKSLVLKFSGGELEVNLQNINIEGQRNDYIVNVYNNAKVTWNLIGSNVINQTLSDYGAIGIEKGSTLTIGGTGKLSSTAATRGSVIGGYQGSNCGTLEVTGGTLEVKQKRLDAIAIGAPASGTMESIWIKGGTVIATGSYHGGMGASCNATLDKLLVTGGKITATSTTTAVGLGSTASNGHVTALGIMGGTITSSNGVGADQIIVLGGNINGKMYSGKYTQVGKAALKSALAARAVAADESDDENLAEPDTSLYTGKAVNSLGQELAAVRITGLPANKSVEGHITFVDVDFVNLSDNPDKVATTLEYGLNDVYTNSEGELTFWLPKSEVQNRLVVASIDGVSYAGAAVQDPSDEEGLLAAMKVTTAKLMYQGFTASEVTAGTDEICEWAEDGAATADHGSTPLQGLRVISPVEGVSVYYSVNPGEGYGNSFVNGNTLDAMAPFYGLYMELAGENAELYQVRYKVQTEDGWSDWAYDGAELNVDKPVLAFAAELVEKPTAEETPAEAEVATQTPAASDVTNAAATSTVKAAGTPQTSDPINLTAFTVLAVAGVLALVGGAVLGVRASKRQ